MCLFFVFILPTSILEYKFSNFTVWCHSLPRNSGRAFVMMFSIGYLNSLISSSPHSVSSIQQKHNCCWKRRKQPTKGKNSKDFLSPRHENSNNKFVKLSFCLFLNWQETGVVFKLRFLVGFSVVLQIYIYMVLVHAIQLFK